VAANDDGDWWIEIDPATDVVDQASSSSLQSSGETEIADDDDASNSAPLRLRPQYDGNLLRNVGKVFEPPVNLAFTQSSVSPENSDPADDPQSSEFESVIPIAARDEDAGPKSRQGAVRSGSAKEEVRMLTYDDAPFAESIEDVQELRRRLQSATSFEPGAVAPNATSDGQLDSATASEHVPKTSILRLRKRRQPATTLSSPLPVPSVDSPKPKQSVVEHTSMVQWRPAKAEMPAPSKTNRPKPEKSASMPEDLRQALPRDPSFAMGMSGSSKDAASAGLEADSWLDSKSVNASTNRSDNAGTSGLVAPLPPPSDPIEWMSFNDSTDQLKPPVDSNSGDEWMSSSMVYSGADDPGQILRKVQADPSDDGGQTPELGEPKRNPIERVAAAMHVSTSTVWTAIGAAAFTMFLAGLWTVRAAVRSRFASNDQ
jgi:hypothetical protein